MPDLKGRRRSRSWTVEPSIASLTHDSFSDYPSYFLAQDIRYAILASRLASEELEAMEHRLAPHPSFAKVSNCSMRERLSAHTATVLSPSPSTTSRRNRG